MWDYAFLGVFTFYCVSALDYKLQGTEAGLPFSLYLLP